MRWNFVSLQKNGNELEDVMLGFLAPNNEDHVGEGFVSFTIDHKPNPANGSTVSNKATIIFDANDPIETNVYTNTFDTDLPTSEITSVAERNGKLVVNIAGNDGTSGIDHYDLFVFLNGTDEYIVLKDIEQDEVEVPLKAGVTKYGFCVMEVNIAGATTERRTYSDRRPYHQLCPYTHTRILQGRPVAPGADGLHPR